MLLLNKPLSLTPYQAIQILKQQQPHLASSTLSAAGRLDPMADGLLLLLQDQENKQQSDYLALAKTYRATILFGLATDSYDLLGLPTQPPQDIAPSALHGLDQVIANHIGLIDQPYPPYSAVQVNGQPLYYWAHHQLLHTIKIPKKTRQIMSIQKEYMGVLSKDYILDNALPIIQAVRGNFRQAAIIKAWQDQLSTGPTSYSILQILLTCSSGTYIRSIIHSIGQQLHLPTLTYSIQRTAIGSHHLDQAQSLGEQYKYSINLAHKK